MNKRNLILARYRVGAWAWCLILMAAMLAPLHGQVSVVSSGPVTTESRQVKLICRLPSGSKSIVGVSGTIEIAGAAFRVGSASRITVSDETKGANLLTDVEATADGAEIIKFGYFSAQPMVAGESLFQLMLIPTGSAIVSGSSIEVRLKGFKTTADGFQFASQPDTKTLLTVQQSNNTRPRFTLVSGVEFFRSRANELQLVATDSESPPSDLKYTLTGAPAGMTLSPAGLVRWTPGLDVTVGQGRFTAQVEDPEGAQDTQEIAYTVREAQALTLQVNQAWIAESVSERFLQVTLSIADLPVTINGVQFKFTYPAHLRPAEAPRAPRFLGDFAKSSVAGLISHNAATRTVSVVANSLESLGAKGQGIFQVTLVPVGSPEPGTNPQFSLAQVYQSSVGTLTPVTSLSVPVANPLGSAPVFRGLADSIVDEVTELKLQLEATDADSDVQTLFFKLVSGPAGMTVSSQGLLRWVPSESQGGSAYPVRVLVSDGLLDTVGQFSVTVRDVNWPPEAISQTQSVIQGESLSIHLEGRDLDGDALKFLLVMSPAKGQLTGTPPELTYRPNPDQIGADQFTFRVNDGLANSSMAAVSISILPAKTAPVAQAQSIATDEDKAASITLSGKVMDGVNPNFRVVRQPTKGVLSGLAPSLTYTPNPNANGADSFVFVVNDGTVDSPQATVAIAIHPVNDAPVALAQAVTVEEDTSKVITLDGTDVEGAALTYAVIGQPSKGILSGVPPNLTYTPKSNANGNDSFTFRVNDGAADSALATVSITINAVNDPPVAIAQSMTTREDIALRLALAGSDIESSTLAFSVVTPPVHGQLTGLPPDLIYQPERDFNGRDSFEFRVSDGVADSAIATVMIEVLAENDAPVLAPVADQVVEPGRSLNLSLSASDVDVPAQALSFRLKSGPLGMTVSAAGQLSWLPRASQRPGIHRVVVEVSDGVAVGETGFSVEAKPAQLVSVFSGVAIDGYIAGARVWFDADLDGSRDPDEPTTTTDRSGNFALDFDSSLFDRNANGRLDPAEGRLVVEGGIDLSSGQPRVGQLTAPAGAQVITPLTTMVDLISRQGGGLTTAQAEEKVRSALGLPAAVSLTSFDPIEAAVRGDAQAAAVQVASASIADTISLLAGVIDGASASVDARKANAVVTETLAARIASAALFDFGSASLLQETISAAAAAVSTAISTDVKAAVAQVVAEQNTAKQEAVANSWNPLEALNAISQVQSVVQGETAGAITRLGSGTLTTDEVRVLYTGDALDRAIAKAPVGDVTASNLKAGNFEFSEASPVVVEGGRVVQPLSVQRKDGSYGAVQVIVRFSGASGILTRDNVVLEFADGVTQLPVDLASLPVDDSVPHADRTVLVDLALGAGFPSGASVTGLRQSSLRVIDNDAVGAIGFSTSKYRGTEGGLVQVDLERSNGSSGRIVAQIRLSGGTAQAGTDFASATVPVIFEPGQSRVVANLGWLDDGVRESAETVDLALEILPGSDPGAALLASKDAAAITVEDKWVPLPSNQAPVALGVAEGTSLSVVEGQKLTLTLRGNDPEGAPITYIRVGSPTKGVLSGRAPNLVYSANLGQQGEDSFSFKVNDGQADSPVFTVQIVVETANVAPVALAQVLTTEPGSVLKIRLAGTDLEGDPLTYRVVTTPSYGTLTGKAPELAYAARPGFTGLDSLEFVANDGRKDSKPQTVWIVVSAGNAAPTASDQRLEMNEDAISSFKLIGSDPEGSPVTYQLVTLPSNGKLSGTAPSLTYTPNQDFNGRDSLTFRVSDGVRLSEEATVSWVVQPVNDIPVGTDQRVDFTNGVPRQITLSGSDVDGDKLTFRVLIPPQRGTLAGVPPGLTYTPAVGSAVEDSFTFEVFDGQAKSVPAKVTLTPRAGNRPPIAAGMNLAVIEDTPFKLQLSGTDPDGDLLSYEIVAPPTRGQLSGTAPNLVYTPATNTSGLDKFAFRVGDAQATSAPAEVLILVSPVNDAPVLMPVADSVIDAGKPWGLRLNALDVDIPAQNLAFSLLQGPVGMKIDAGGNLTWTPGAQQLGDQLVEVSVSDGALADSLRFRLRVEPVNTPPQFPDIAVRRVSEGNLLAFNLTATDTDQPAQALAFGLVSGPEGLTVSAQGLVSWKPTEAQGPSTNLVWLRVTDNGKPSLSATNSVQIIVREVNQAPILPDPGVLALDALRSWTRDLGAKDVDLPAQTLFYQLVRGPQGLVISTNGILQWTPTLIQAGDHVVEVSVSDGTLKVSRSMTLRVGIVNTAPVLSPVGVRRVAEGNLLSFQLSATDAEQSIQRLTFGLVSGPDGLAVGTNGWVTWKPTEAQGPSTNLVRVRVTDDGQPALSQTNSIEIVVREVNQPPVPVVVATRRVSEGNLISFTLSATDGDLPAQQLTYSLASGPAGLTVSTNGLVAWKPTEAQGPSTNLVLIRVTDSGSPALSATNSVEIIVREVNLAPEIVAVGPKALLPGTDWSFALRGTDADIPAQTLSFRWLTGPVGLTVTTNGVVRWKPTAAQLGVHPVTFSLSDGSATVQGSFQITVANQIDPRLQISSINGSTVVLSVRGLSGFDYKVESTSSLGSSGWTATGDIWVQTMGYDKDVLINLTDQQGSVRFYRLLLP